MTHQNRKKKLDHLRANWNKENLNCTDVKFLLDEIERLNKLLNKIRDALGKE